MDSLFSSAHYSIFKFLPDLLSRTKAGSNVFLNFCQNIWELLKPGMCYRIFPRLILVASFLDFPTRVAASTCGRSNSEHLCHPVPPNHFCHLIVE